MDSIDKLLSELKAEYQQPCNSQAERIEEVEKAKKANIVKKINFDSSPSSSEFFASSPSKGDTIDNLLAEVKQDFEQNKLLEEQQKQEQIEKERIREQELKAKQLEALKNQAQEWLEKLEPLSPEGLWFESFAQNYSSKLDAAIEYLNTQ